MIAVVVGEDVVARDEAIAMLRQKHAGEVERYDGEDLAIDQLPSILQGATLFSSERFVIIAHTSKNKSVWEKLVELLATLDDSSCVVLLESSLDKRTKAFKTLAKIGKIIDAAPPMQRDSSKVQKWLLNEAVKRQTTLSASQANRMIERALIPGERPGQAMIDRSLLLQALEVLSLKSSVRDEDIADVLTPTPQENVFELFTTMLQGRTAEVAKMIEALEMSQEAHMVFGLLSGQLVQLTGLVAGKGKNTEQVAKDIGVHPYALGQLANSARSVSLVQLTWMVEEFSATDALLKTSAIEPWTAVGHLAIKIAQKQA